MTKFRLYNKNGMYVREFCREEDMLLYVDKKGWDDYTFQVIEC